MPVPSAFHDVVLADPCAPSVIRRRLNAWLSALSWPVDAAQDVILAVNEAVSNAAEHAYPPSRPGTIEVSVTAAADLADGCQVLTVTVSDQGIWRPVPEQHEYRRRGIPLMRALSALLHIATDANGTRVTMTTHPALQPAPALAKVWTHGTQ
ncbi:MAG TPA: ATP-binding protein [Pseudonocardia sp.]|jgi:anti-sigma regulatory factor (Ser/Thr protein kinase)|uniref:ATP-binding protein n=1 Tax=Pseudonocardia sp. TaxID=60912 RepID=UPI002F405FBF